MKIFIALSILSVVGSAVAEEGSYHVPVYGGVSESGISQLEVEEVRILGELRAPYELKLKLTYENEVIGLIPAHWVGGVGFGREVAEGSRRPVVSTVVRVPPDKLVVILRGMVLGEWKDYVYLAQAAENGEWDIQRLEKDPPEAPAIFHPKTPENTPPAELSEP